MASQLSFQDVLDHFGGTQTALAAELECTRELVTSWGGVIPELWAYKIESISKGSLKYSQMPVRLRRTRAA